MNIIKYEADDDVASNTNTIVIQNSKTQQVFKNYVHIKEEPELIIKSEFSWVPTNLKDEQQEYQQYQDTDASDCKHVFNTIKPDPMDYEEHSTEYLDNEWENDDIEDVKCKYDNVDYEEHSTEYLDNEWENDDIEDVKCKYDNVDYDEDNAVELLNNEWELNEYESSNDMDDEDDHYNDYNLNIDCNSNTESTQNQDLFENAVAANGPCASTKSFNKQQFFKWLGPRYIKFVCPICDNIYKNERPRLVHIAKKHRHLVEKTLSDYYFNSTTKYICKICKKRVFKGGSLLLHSLRHSNPGNLNILYECEICHIKFKTRTLIQNHIMEQHPEIKESFISLNTISINKKFECPSCPAIYWSLNSLRYHFIDKHPIEYWDMFTFPCHLCPTSTNRFDDILEFYKHLMKEHNLNDLKSVNIKISTEFSDKQHFICTKCFKIFTVMDMKKFLRHYLEHANYFWSCRICLKKLLFRNKYAYHMCGEMFKKYRALAKENLNQVRKTLTNWQEFEDYMKHVCSFCNREFETLKKWQLHLRRTHHIDTLKGLEMKEIPNESTKLQCNTCNTFVLNTSVELHIHRFQHLPYKPYKCRHCYQTVNNYKMALNHVLKKCKDVSKESQTKVIRNSHVIVCPLCSDRKFVNKTAILQHHLSEHNNFQNYYTKQLENTMICNICKLQLADDKKLCRRHVLSHFYQKTYQCLECFQSFHNRIPSVRHVKRHFTKPITNLQRDSSNFSLMPTNCHELTANKNQCTKTVLERSSVLSEFVDLINYACPKCNVCLATHQLWQQHILEKHDIFQDDKICIKDSSDGSLKCIHCQLKMSTSVAQRQKHQLTHMPYKSFICSVCYHRCNSLGVLYGHLRRQHLARGSHKCPICSDILSTPLERMQHLKNSHSPSKWPDNMCTECYKMFASEKTLRAHMVTHDLERNKFECKYCDAKYVDKKDLRYHEASRHEKNMVAGGSAEKDMNSVSICTETPKSKGIK